LGKDLAAVGDRLLKMRRKASAALLVIDGFEAKIIENNIL
jgi:hypothetical protein